jgi:predicted Zn-dependent protease
MSKILEIFDKCLKKSKADQTELVCESEEFYLTRFADSVIHQNMGRKDHTVWCRAAIGKKVGIASGNDISMPAINNLIKSATEICAFQSDNPQFPGLFASPCAPRSTGFVQATANYSPSNRAGAIKTISDIAAIDRLLVSGMYQTSQTELAVANSLGTRQDGKATEAKISITLSGDGGRAGFAQAYSRDADKIDYADIARRAVAKASRPQEPVSLEPGKYDVILDPEAVADFLLFLGFLGFGGKGLFNRRSFMANKIGSQIMADKITITEDPLNSEIGYIGFDYEGVCRRRVPLVQRGIGMGVVNDNMYGQLNTTGSTGNALRPGNNFGPYPVAMVMEPGELSIEEIIGATQKAIWITHFWYLNYLNPMMTTVTGTTRDGTFLIDSGKIAAPVIDMRISQSMLEAFNNVEAISSQRRLVPKYGSLMYVPAMKITDFNFVPKE